MRGYLLVPALILGVLVYAIWGADSGIPSWLRMRREVAAAGERIATLEREIAALRNEAQALEDDPFAIERAIREELDLGKPGETLVRLPREPNTNP